MCILCSTFIIIYYNILYFFRSAMTDADPGSRPTHSISDSDSDSEPDPLPSRPAASSVPTTSHKIPTSSHTSCATKTKLQRQESIPKPAAKTRVGTSAGNSTTVPTVGPATSCQGSCSSAMPRVTSLPSSQSSTDSLRSASEDVAHFVLHPGSFEVVLCVDNREFYGRWVSRVLCVVCLFVARISF